jgi:hypothetical protein
MQVIYKDNRKVSFVLVRVFLRALCGEVFFQGMKQQPRFSLNKLKLSCDHEIFAHFFVRSTGSNLL